MAHKRTDDRLSVLSALVTNATTMQAAFKAAYRLDPPLTRKQANIVDEMVGDRFKPHLKG
jgi:hypothetical protein